mgnify:FL=1|tara:strand:- start:169 stop:816 length:648 start_codon:yes stop_codon:yes gene_type:complete
MARPGSTTSETGNNYNTANGTGAAVRTKLNEIFTALRTLSSGSSDPSGAASIAQYQPHINTSTNLLKIATAVSGDSATYNTLGNITLDNLGHVVAASPTMTGDVTMSSTGFLKVPVGTNAQQPGQSGQPAAAAGQFRYNSNTSQFEGYTTSWGAIGGGGGATGGGTEAIFHENENAMDQDYTIGDGTSNINAGVFGPLTINAVLTIPSGSVVSIV